MAMDRHDSGLLTAAALFRSLGDPARLAIVRRLATGEARVVDLTRLLGLAQSTVSKHVACLLDCGLLDRRLEGRQSFYFLTHPELSELLRSAEMLLARTGATVALCDALHAAGGGAGRDESSLEPSTAGVGSS